MTGIINGTGNVEGVHIDNSSLFYYIFGTFVSGVRFIMFTIQWLFMYSTAVNITVQLFCATRAHILSTFEIFQVEKGNNSLKKIIKSNYCIDTGITLGFYIGPST